MMGWWRKMALLKQVVYGLYLGAAYMAVLLFGESLSPGLIGANSLGAAGLLSIFSMMVLESFVSLR